MDDEAIGTAARRQVLTAPLPVLGLSRRKTLGRSFSIAGQVETSKVKVGDYDGNLLTGEVDVGYDLTDRIDVGAFYRYVDYTVDITKTGFSGTVEYEFSGPGIFVQYGF